MYTFANFIADNLVLWVLVVVCSIGLGLSLMKNPTPRNAWQATSNARYQRIVTIGVVGGGALACWAIIIRAAYFVASFFN